MSESLFVGLMSGTSVDGIDAALVSISGDNPPRIRLMAARGEPMPPALRERILELTLPGDNEIDRLGELDVDIGRHFAEAALRLIAEAGIRADAVIAIGSHGQTIRHRPGASSPFTLQIGDPNTIAELTGITTVADFRRRDMAAGGQGAPLVPAFHDAVFRSATDNRLLLNVGGMANVTVLAADGRERVRGFDTGPGNVLLDAWHERHQGGPVDRDGAWARSGTPDTQLLAALIGDRYFHETPPKSTGREYFSLEWLDGVLSSDGRDLQPANVQATLVELTARSVADAIGRWGVADGCVYLCGGGTHNGFLRDCLASAMPRHRILSTRDIGIDPDWVEAMAFAWLAYRTLARLPANLPAVTGARHPVILGGIYPAHSHRPA